jgi:uncharacterized protein YmfQ (DUF2313 family)
VILLLFNNAVDNTFITEAGSATDVSSATHATEVLITEAGHAVDSEGATHVTEVSVTEAGHALDAPGTRANMHITIIEAGDAADDEVGGSGVLASIIEAAYAGDASEYFRPTLDLTPYLKPAYVMPTPQYDAADLFQLIQNLLPVGPAYPRLAGTTQTALLEALAGSEFIVQTAAVNLLSDVFPASTIDYTQEWMKSVGLPDPCWSGTPTIEQIQNAIVARLVAQGGASIPYLEHFCATLGFPDTTFTEFGTFGAGSTAGSRCNGRAWAYALEVNNPAFVINYFRAGLSGAGDPLATWGNSALICELKRIVGAHITLIFDYT